MSRSFRKNVFDSFVCYSRKSMKAWRTQENRRLRHNAKRLINTCLDYDALVVPVLNDYDTLWGSPIDGKKHIINAPLLNQCIIDDQEYVMRWGRFSSRYEINEDGHHEYCDCYTNKRSYYWKARRK